MNIQLTRFFNAAFAPNAHDGLKQEQREAIVDLLNFCRIADDKLVPCEEGVSAAEEAAFTWDAGVPLVAYAAASLERAAEAVQSPERREAFLNDVAHRLATSEARTRAVAFCCDMFVCDGEFATRERVVFQEIKRAMGWPEETRPVPNA